MMGLLSAINRRIRWSEGHIFAITPEQIGIVEGLRASFAIAVMLAVSLLLQIPDLAFGAVAAFWTCLCDPGGSDRNRLKTMAGFAIGATLAISIAAYCAHWGRPAAGAALFLLVLACGLTRSYRPSFGPMPAPAALLAAIAVVVGVTAPRDAAGAIHLGSCFLLGCLWALVLCLSLWRTHPRAPARRAQASIFGRLRDMTASLLALDLEAESGGRENFNVEHRRAVRFSIERGRESVARLSAGRTRFGQGIDAAGRVFAAVMAIGHYRSESPQPFDPAAERPLLDGLRNLLQEAAPPSHELAAKAETLLRQAQGPGVVPHAVAVAAEALLALARHWQEPEPADQESEAPAASTSLKILAPVWRQALRVAVAVTVSFALGAWYEVSFSYWGTIATLVLMQPLGANTWLRVLERAAGSIVGGVLTAILIARLSGPWEMLLFIAPLSAAVIALRLVNYGLFVMVITPMFVLVSDFIHPASDLISTRAINEIIGACIGLAGSLLLWPEKEKNALADAVLAAIAANLAFAAAMLRARDDIDPARRDAGIASARAEVARQRMRLQGRSRSARLDRIHDILVALRALCGATNILAITRQCASTGADEARAERYDALAKLLRAEFLGDGNRAAIAPLDIEDGDDLDHAVHALVLAVRDYTIYETLR